MPRPSPGAPARPLWPCDLAWPGAAVRPGGGRSAGAARRLPAGSRTDRLLAPVDRAPVKRLPGLVRRDPASVPGGRRTKHLALARAPWPRSTRRSRRVRRAQLPVRARRASISAPRQPSSVRTSSSRSHTAAESTRQASRSHPRGRRRISSPPSPTAGRLRSRRSNRSSSAGWTMRSPPPRPRQHQQAVRAWTRTSPSCCSPSSRPRPSRRSGPRW